MKFAIISAGEGSRLAQEGVTYPKPLVPLQGTPIIERLIKLFIGHNAESVNIIINSRQPETEELLRELSKENPINIVVKDTPSSMHSLYAIRDYLEVADRFCVTTVDTIFSEREFGAYIHAFEKSNLDGLMAVTSYVDDEKPLYVQTADDLTITNFCDSCQEHCHHVSGGIYCLTRKALDTLSRCINQGQSRMRNFQRQLVADGLTLQAYPFSKIIDVDHCTDILKAEQLIREWQRA